MSNRLKDETSPYLIQHAHNPVDWYPWGPEALGKARAEDRPILLSIGYSACHWCHVMERESFENEAIAGLMNEHFVSIKVDREERPDLDSIYMAAVQGMTGHGGWPMTVFLTPEGVPFYGGTYFPPEDRQGMPGFPRVLLSVAAAYREQRDRILESAGRIQEFLQHQSELVAEGDLSEEILTNARALLSSQFDERNGGFDGAPKFPQPMGLELLLRVYTRLHDARALQMVEFTLDRMARGGIYDQVGGGFARYSVDATWLVPHFEKMLYDNAQLAALYLHAYQATGKLPYRRVCEETLEYVGREMTDPTGAFYSTQDADSEGEEGKFYLWTPREIGAALGTDEAGIVEMAYGVTQRGNFEGRNILFQPNSPDALAQSLGMTPEALDELLTGARRKLYEARAQRVWPGRDEKVVTSWNGLMLRAFAEAGAALGRPDFVRAAERNAELVLGSLRQDGRLLRTWRDGRAKLNGYLEDYSFYADGLLALYQATFDPRWFAAARELADTAIDLFWDPVQRKFFDTARDHELLVSRPRNVYDNATPSGTSVMTDVLLRLAAYTGNGGPADAPDGEGQRYRGYADEVLRSMAQFMERAPGSFGRLLCALDFALARPREVAVVGDPAAPDTSALLDVVRGVFRPNLVLAAGSGPDSPEAAVVPLLQDRPVRGGKATAYVCAGFVCQAPTTEPEELRRQLEG
ncbi:MAG: thioredoxin domain-containing protein [Chloroflexi bacterium]|nr:thioredoxin domain-containing protein [Chloroflexota bacterium]